MTLYAAYIILEEIIHNQNEEIKINLNNIFIKEEIILYNEDIIDKVKIFMKMKHFQDKLKSYNDFNLSFNGEVFIFRFI